MALSVWMCAGVCELVFVHVCKCGCVFECAFMATMRMCEFFNGMVVAQSKELWSSRRWVLCLRSVTSWVLE